MAKILLIDDSLFSRKLSRKALDGAGHEVVEVVNGAEGLEAVRQHDPDCVVLDLLMPVLDGPGFLAGLRPERADLPVVVLTADIQAGSRAKCEALGISGFLSKPCPAEALVNSVAAALAAVEPASAESAAVEAASNEPVTVEAASTEPVELVEVAE